MTNYRIPKDISAELKINKALYLFDLLFIIGMIVVTMIFNVFVHDTLKIPFYIFMGMVSLVMLWRPLTNPQKRMYEVLIITMVRKQSTYCALDSDQD